MATETLELTIAALGGRGDGIAETPAGPVYVPFTAPGDRVRVRLGPKRGAGRAAEAIALLAPGPDRAEPACPHFGTCGGCALQHVAPDFYAEWKRDRVRAALARRGLAEVAIAPLVGTPPGSRRRADLGLLRLGDGRLLVGYHTRASHRLVDLAACPVLDPALVALTAPLRAAIGDLLPPGARGAAIATLTEGGVDLLLELPRPPDLAGRERLAGFADAADLARLTLRIDGAEDPIARRRPATVSFGGVTAEPPPGAFLQASPAVEAALIAEARAATAGAGRIADLFCGSGTFALPLADGAAVHAVDGDESAIAALVAAASKAGRRVATEVRDLSRRPLTPDELAGFDAALFDPPRAGAKEQAAALAQAKVPTVVGVSCNPASFARDARILVDGGFALTRVQPLDQFLWSPHVELVGVLRR